MKNDVYDILPES